MSLPVFVRLHRLFWLVLLFFGPLPECGAKMFENVRKVMKAPEEEKKKDYLTEMEQLTPDVTLPEIFLGGLEIEAKKCTGMPYGYSDFQLHLEIDKVRSKESQTIFKGFGMLTFLDEYGDDNRSLSQVYELRGHYQGGFLTLSEATPQHKNFNAAETRILHLTLECAGEYEGKQDGERVSIADYPVGVECQEEFIRPTKRFKEDERSKALRLGKMSEQFRALQASQRPITLFDKIDVADKVLKSTLDNLITSQKGSILDSTDKQNHTRVFYNLGTLFPDATHGMGMYLLHEKELVLAAFVVFIQGGKQGEYEWPVQRVGNMLLTQFGPSGKLEWKRSEGKSKMLLKFNNMNNGRGKGSTLTYYNIKYVRLFESIIKGKS